MNPLRKVKNSDFLLFSSPTPKGKKQKIRILQKSPLGDLGVKRLIRVDSFIRTTVVLFPILVFISCEIKTEWKLETDNYNFVVVNGQITNEKKAHQVILSRPVNQLNEVPEPISSASVNIYDGDSLYTLKEDLLKPGTYKTDSTFRAFINKPYTLLVTVNNQQYYSSVIMLPVIPFNTLKYKFVDEKQMYTIDSVTQAFDNQESAMYEILIDWTHVPGYEYAPIESKKAVMFYYTLSTLDISEVFKSETEQIYFPTGTIITEKKYSLTKQHAEFIRSLLLETEWRGGLFDVAHGNMKTNLSKGALGFFGASSVFQKTFQVK